MRQIALASYFRNDCRPLLTKADVRGGKFNKRYIS
jgi:hypothetical protein